MKAVVQRVLSARVSVDGEVVGHCGPGLLVLAAAHRNDTDKDAAKTADRIVGMRIFNDDEGRINLAIRDLPPSTEPRILAISNFTLYGDPSKNRRPSFMEAAPFERGKELFDALVGHLRSADLVVSTGVFGADMRVEVCNDGPVTIIVETFPAS